MSVLFKLIGEYGLEQAMDEIKQLRRRIKSREKYIEELVQSVNELQLKLGNQDPISGKSDESLTKTNNNKALLQVRLKFIFASIDPLGLFTISAGGDHRYFHTRRPSVCPSPFFKIAHYKHFSSENSDCYSRNCRSARGDHG